MPDGRVGKMKQIRIACKGAIELDYKELNELQGDLKDLSEEDYLKLETEILETGFAFTPHIWKDEKKKKWFLVDGHQRIRVVRVMVEQKGYSCPPIPCSIVEAKDLKEAKRRVLQGTSQYGKMTEDGLYEFSTSAELSLKQLTDSFRLPDIDMEHFGANFYKEQENSEEDDSVPEIAQGPSVCQPGNLWILGEHRLLCGDSTKRENVERLMNGEKADMVFTDPPYGINAVGCLGTIGGSKRFGTVAGPEKHANKIIKANRYSPVIGDDTTDTAKKCFDVFKDLAEVIVLWGAQCYAEHLPPSQGWIVWDKDTTGNLGDGELAWTNQDRAIRIFKHTWNGLIKESERTERRCHPTQKPAALAIWVFEKYGHPKLVFDGFLGSGSTLIACEKKNRKCYGMEIDPHYCDVILERWAKYTEKDPIREDGKPWSILKPLRIAP
jgi:DNA modification methylase